MSRDPNKYAAAKSRHAKSEKGRKAARPRERAYYHRNRKTIAERRRKHRSHNPRVVRAWRLKTKYGLTPEQWDELFEQQGRSCAICKTPTPNGNAGTWATDHDHKTGKVRGILCNSCNHGLGQFRDNPTVLRLAAEYLEAPS